ncbi:MAG: hypothetical protein NC901_00130 [Candidatus Omnitrophica bacterium]|nr:hypothetical protein [Candidatus Omnitrophota bacterium]
MSSKPDASLKIYAKFYRCLIKKSIRKYPSPKKRFYKKGENCIVVSRGANYKLNKKDIEKNKEYIESAHILKNTNPHC